MVSDSSRDLFTKAILCSKQGMTVKITWTVNGVTVAICQSCAPLTVRSQVGSETDQSLGHIITVKNGGFVRQKKPVTDCSVHLHT